MLYVAYRVAQSASRPIRAQLGENLGATGDLILKKQSQFAGTGMNVTLYPSKVYDNMPAFRLPKNKANLPAFGRKSEALRKESQGRSSKSEIRDLNGAGLRKTKPICDEDKWRKCYSGRRIWRYAPILGAKKQSQFKPNFTAPARTGDFA